MLRRFVAMLLCLVLVLGMTTQISAAAEEEPLLEVTLSVYSNLNGNEDIDCLYRDNVLYIDPITVCKLTGALIHEDAGDSVTFSLHDGLRHIQVTSEGRMHEELTMGRAYSVSADIPAVMCGGEVWTSASQLLRYMGAVVGFGENEISPTHMMVSMPYTIYDLIVEFLDVDGYWFSWAEAEGKFVDPEDMVYLAAVDTILLGYDSNLLAYISPAHGDKVQKDIYTDLLSEILRTEGAELNDGGYNEVDLFEDASDTWSFSAAWVGEVLDWISDEKFAGKLNSSMSGALNASGVMLSAGGDYLESLSAAMQFANMSNTQKELLDNTLNLVSPYNPYYQELPLLFETAEEVSSLIGNKYAAQEKAAWDGIYSLMVNSATTAMNSINPFALAWDSLITIAKLDPLLEDFLNDEKSITFAAEAQNIALIARNLASEDWSNLYAHNFYMLTDDTRYHEYIKLDIILELKATLLIRQLLANTGWLTDGAEYTIQHKIRQTAELLNKAQNAKCTTFGDLDHRKEDIRWIANLGGNCKIGWVMEDGDYTYYWQLEDQDYDVGAYDIAYTGQTENSFVELVRRDSKGNVQELFAVENAGDFAVARGNVYYCQDGDIYVCNAQTKVTDNLGSYGVIVGINHNGSVLICRDGDALYGYYTNSGQWRRLANNATYLTVYKNVLYYSPYATDHEAAQKGQVTLAAVDLGVQGSNRNLCTTEPDLYPYGTAQSEAMIGQIYFTDENIYFSYGSIGGTGMMYQGGKVMRVNYDGTQPTVVAGDGNLVGADFYISNGRVQVDYEDYFYVSFDSLRDYEQTDEGIRYFDDVTGKPSTVIKLDEYQDGSKDVCRVGRVMVYEDKVYYLVYYGTHVPDMDFGWRYYYSLDYCALYVKDRRSDEVTLIYKTTPPQ